MAQEAAQNAKFKIIPDWTLPEGKAKKQGKSVRMHPYAVISFTQKKFGIRKAAKIAIALMKRKYNRVLEDSKAVYQS